MTNVPKKILVPVDLSERAELAVSYAAEIARRFDGELVVTINVNLPERETLEAFAMNEHMSTEDAARSTLQRLATRLASDVKTTFDLRTRDSPADGILDAASDYEVDAIVLASHGRTGMSRWLLGSVAQKIVGTADVPVIVVPARD